MLVFLFVLLGVVRAAPLPGLSCPRDGGANTGWREPKPHTCDDTGWRDPKCDFCNCCPVCWSCAELLAAKYNCPGRAGLEVSETVIDKGEVSIHEFVSWDLGKALGSSRFESGWQQCFSWPVLVGTGLDFFDNGAILPMNQSTMFLTFPPPW